MLNVDKMPTDIHVCCLILGTGFYYVAPFLLVSLNTQSFNLSLDKDKYLTPAPNLHRTRASHDLQYTGYFAYSDALKNSFFPRTIPLRNSLPSSVVSSKTIEEFKGLI